MWDLCGGTHGGAQLTFWTTNKFGDSKFKAGSITRTTTRTRKRRCGVIVSVKLAIEFQIQSYFWHPFVGDARTGTATIWHHCARPLLRLTRKLTTDETSCEGATNSHDLTRGG